MSLMGPGLSEEEYRFPRVSGDEPHADTSTVPLSKFSPRERG